MELWQKVKFSAMEMAESEVLSYGVMAESEVLTALPTYMWIVNQLKCQCIKDFTSIPKFITNQCFSDG